MRNPKFLARAFLVGAAVAGFSTGAFAAASTPPEPDCLRSINIDGWNATGNNDLVITDKSDRQYSVHVGGACPGLRDTRLAITIETRAAQSCVQSGDQIYFRDYSFGPQRCLITAVEPVTHDMSGSE